MNLWIEEKQYKNRRKDKKQETRTNPINLGY